MNGADKPNGQSHARNIALIGECMVELQRDSHGTLNQTFGGDTFNTAVYMARLGTKHGIQANYISALGDDAFSVSMRQFWSGQGVDSSLTRILPGKRPGLYFIDVDEKGERSFTYWRGEAAVRDLFLGEAGHNLLGKLENFDSIYLSGISLAVLHEPGRSELIHKLQLLHEAGHTIFFDCNFRPALWGANLEEALAAARPCYSQMLAIADFLFISRDEFACMGREKDENPEAACRSLVEEGRCEVILKDGGGICYVGFVHKTGEIGEAGKIGPKNSKHGEEAPCICVSAIPAQIVEDVVDTTAAGDSFSAAYIVGRQLGLGPDKAAAKAHILSAAVVRHKGAIIPLEAIPNIFSDM